MAGKSSHSFMNRNEDAVAATWDRRRELKNSTPSSFRTIPSQEHIDSLDREFENFADSEAHFDEGYLRPAPRSRTAALERLEQIRNHLDCRHDHAHRHEELDAVSEDDLKHFDCGNVECHHMLALQNSGMAPEGNCIHADCGEVSSDRTSWLRHVLSPHHGSRSASSSADNSPSCPGYSGETTEYFGEHW